MNNKTLTKVVGGVLVSGMLLSVGGIALAQDDNVTKVPSQSGKTFFHDKAWKKPDMMGHRGGFGHKRPGFNLDNLDALVKDGVISQDKADKIKAYAEKAAQERQAQHDKFKQMTPEQREAEFEKIKQMTPEERKAQWPHKNLWQQLVDNKVLTQTEVDTLKAKIREKAQAQHQQRIANGLKTLVDKGTLTQAQADKVTQQFAAVQKEHQALFEKVKGMTPEERKAYFQENKANLKKDPLSTFVNDGTLTQAQAQAIKELFHAQKPKAKK